MRFFQLLRAMFRRVAQWGRRILPLAAGADSPIEHRTYQQETVIAMPERDQPDSVQHPDSVQPDWDDVQPVALPLANQSIASDSTLVEESEDSVVVEDSAGEDALDPGPASDVGPSTTDASDDETPDDETPDDEPFADVSTDADLGLDDPALQPLVSLLESLLFVAEDAVTPDKLAQALDRTIGEVEAGLTVLARRCEAENRGIRVQRRSGRVQLVTNPAAAQAVENFLNLDLTTHLSGPALEALAVVAYQQPVTRTQIEAVRGVDCSGVLRKLQQQGLIEEVGRLETIGRPILYGVTDLFMQHFGLTSLTELPQLPEVDADALAAAVELVEEEGNE